MQYDKAVISTNHTTKDFVPDKKIIEENSILLTPSLRLAPPVDAHVELPSIDISEYFSGQSISLNAFEMRKGVRTKGEYFIIIMLERDKRISTLKLVAFKLSKSFVMSSLLQFYLNLTLTNIR